MKEFHSQEENSSPPSKGGVFSFWKPDPVPPKEAKILPVELHSLGKLHEVAERICEVPHMTRLPSIPWEENQDHSTVRLQWQVEKGVILLVRTEQGPPLPGEVLTIRAKSHTSNRAFYRLYVQLFEQFGVTVLDERLRDFVTPREFRSGLAG